MTWCLVEYSTIRDRRLDDARDWAQALSAAGIISREFEKKQQRKKGDVLFARQWADCTIAMALELNDWAIVLCVR